MENPSTDTAISLQGFIPVRKEPRERAEMVTQVLFGEVADILDEAGKWTFILTRPDQYEGWIDNKCIERIREIPKRKYIVTTGNMVIWNLTRGHNVILPIGSALPALYGQEFTLADNTYKVANEEVLTEPGKAELEKVFPELISIPYLWGGRCGFGFDCSGLTQFLCRLGGTEIPRDAGDQSAIGETLSFLNEARSGDLAFFDNAEGMIHHVGMITPDKRIIHASGMVRVDRIDQQGIFNEEIGAYTHKLRVIKRIR